MHTSITFHHVLTIFASIINYFYTTLEGKYIVQVTTFYLSSTPTVFLDIYRFTCHHNYSKYIQDITFLTFVSTFMYYRIYLMTFFIRDIISLIGIYEPRLSILYIFYILNIFWLSILLKKTGKLFRNSLINTSYQ